MIAIALAIAGGCLALAIAINMGLNELAESILTAARRIEIAIYELCRQKGGTK